MYALPEIQLVKLIQEKNAEKGRQKKYKMIHAFLI